MVENLEAPPMYPHPVDFVFAKCGHYLAMFHSIDEEPTPLQAIGLYLVAKADHFSWKMIGTSYNWVG